MDAAHQLRLPLPGAQRQGQAATQHGVFGKVCEAKCVGLAAATGLQDTVVAGQFALGTKLALDPKQSGVEREKDQGQLLDQVGPVVAAAQMLHFMQDHLTQFFGREPLEQCGRKKDAWMEEAENAGTCDFSGSAEFGVSLTPAAGDADLQEKLDVRTCVDRCGARRQAVQTDGACDQLDSSNEQEKNPDAGDDEAPMRAEFERHRMVEIRGMPVREEQRNEVEQDQEQEDVQPDNRTGGGAEAGKQAQA